jgi:hypothetical protein
MTISINPRAVLLPVLAAALVGGVLGVELASGGGDFVPARAADPCTVRSVTSVSTGIDGLTERLVLLGIDRAACRLGVTREALVLTLATEAAPTTAEVDALRAGLLQAVDLMKADGSLPKASALSDEALDNSDLNGFVKLLIRALPDSVIDGALKTDDVLKRTISNLDLRSLLADLNNPDELRSRISAAVTQAVKDALVARLHDLLP